jgi:outer membrane immunogenic protein
MTCEWQKDGANEIVSLGNGRYCPAGTWCNGREGRGIEGWRQHQDDRYDKVFSWTGVYAGATAGGGWGESRFDDSGFKSNPFDVSGFIAGVTLGYNLQVAKNWVVGIEADISYSDVSGSFGPGNLAQPNGDSFGCGSVSCVTDVNWFGTVRGRIGYAVNTVLLYGTGGLAFGKVESDIVNDTEFSARDINAGWTAGAGVEFAFAPHVSAKIEYLHVDLGWTDRTGPRDFRADAEFDVVRAGLNFRFGHDNRGSLK